MSFFEAISLRRPSWIGSVTNSGDHSFNRFLMTFQARKQRLRRVSSISLKDSLPAELRHRSAASRQRCLRRVVDVLRLRGLSDHRKCLIANLLVRFREIVGVEICPLDIIARDEFLDIDRPSRFQLDRFQADTCLAAICPVTPIFDPCVNPK